MVLGLFVYLSLLILLPLFGYDLKYKITIYRNIRIHPFYWFGIIYFTLIIGLRYDVGVDYLLYREVFLGQVSSRADFTAHIGNYVSFEPGFSIITNFFAKHKMPPCYLFLSIAFLQILFLFKFCERYKSIAGWLMFFFITSSTFFDSLNTMRQMVAFYMFLCTLIFIEQRKFFHFFCTIIIISLFHRSIFLVLPLYFFVHKQIIRKRLWGFILIIISFFFSTPINHLIWNTLFPSIGQLFSAFEDVAYLQQRDDLTVSSRENSLGLIQIIYFCLDMLTVYYIPKLRNFYTKSFNIDIFFNLFLIGSFIYYFSTESITITRLNYYFVNTRFIMLAFITYMLTQNLKTNNKFINFSIISILIFISLAIFFNAILHGTKILPYQFI